MVGRAEGSLRILLRPIGPCRVCRIVRGSRLRIGLCWVAGGLRRVVAECTCKPFRRAVLSAGTFGEGVSPHIATFACGRN